MRILVADVPAQLGRTGWAAAASEEPSTLYVNGASHRALARSHIHNSTLPSED